MPQAHRFKVVDLALRAQVPATPAGDLA